MSVIIKDMDMPVDCLSCKIDCKHEGYMVTGRPFDCPLEEAKDGDLIRKADAIEAMTRMPGIGRRAIDALSALPSAEAVQIPIKLEKRYPESKDEDITDAFMRGYLAGRSSAEAEPKMTEEVREALMRLTMCAREECGMCKYKETCGFDFQYKISTENMHTLLEALSAEAVQGEWIHDGQNFKGGINWCHCSKCGHKTSANGLSIFRYCPSCGARMTPYKGGEDE